MVQIMMSGLPSGLKLREISFRQVACRFSLPKPVMFPQWNGRCIGIRCLPEALRGDDSSAVDAGQVVISFLVSFTQSFFLIHNEQFKGVGIE